jgi:hypothetical protein
VHFPKGILVAGRLGGLSRDYGFVVDRNQGEVAINNPYLTVVSVYQTLYQGANPGAARSLEVSVFHQGNQRVLWPF